MRKASSLIGDTSRGEDAFNKHDAQNGQGCRHHGDDPSPSSKKSKDISVDVSKIWLHASYFTVNSVDIPDGNRVNQPSPGIAVPSSAIVLAPVQARMPPTSHTISATPGDGTFVSIEPGEVKIPLPITMLMTMPKASMAPRLRVNFGPNAEVDSAPGSVPSVPLESARSGRRAPSSSD